MSAAHDPSADPDSLHDLLTQATGAWRITIPDQEALLAKLKCVSSLLTALGKPVTAPSLLSQRSEHEPVAIKEIKDSLTVGRNADAGWPLSDVTRISRIQFRVFFENGGWWVEDPGSKNGTFLMGSKERIKRRPLASGDVIQAGGLAFAFVLPE